MPVGFKGEQSEINVAVEINGLKSLAEGIKLFSGKVSIILYLAFVKYE